MVVQVNKLQSAFEYLMTYGWAVAIITIVLGIFYYLGFFGSSSLVSSQACVATTGYSCSGLVLNITGNVMVTVGQANGYPITVSAIACTNGTTAPSSSVAVTSTVLQSYSSTEFIFQCPGAGRTLGAPYTGYLWVTYSTPTQANQLVQVARFSAKVTTLAGLNLPSGSSPSNTVTYCTSTGNIGSNSVSASSGCGLYFCAGGNYNSGMSSVSWTLDAESQSDFSSSGSQSSYTCTGADSDPSDEAIAVAGFNGISTYSIINAPTTFNGVGSSFTSNYFLTSTSNVLLLLACGDYPCTSITFPSGCTTKVSENVGSANEGTAAIAYCQSQASGAYTISGGDSSGSARITVEAALLSGSGFATPTVSLTLSNGNSIVPGAADTALGSTTQTGDTVEIESCNGISCMPNNVIATGTNTASYSLNGLLTGNYVFESCDTSIDLCTSLDAVTVSGASCFVGGIGYNSVSASSGCGLYFCAGANYGGAMTSVTWGLDVEAQSDYASSGSQSSYTCTGASSDPTAETIAVAGFNGVSTYSIIDAPSTFNGISASFTSNYFLTSTSNVLLLVTCGDYPCTSVTFPSGCTTEVAENIANTNKGTAAIAYCQSESSGAYAISGSASSSSARIAVEAALFSGNGFPTPAVTLTFSDGNSIVPGAPDNALGSTSRAGDTVAIESCNGLSCTPNNVITSGANAISYSLNGLVTGDYVFEACDTTIGLCSSPESFTVSGASCFVGGIGYNSVSASPGCGLYFCAGANYNSGTTSVSWTQDVETQSDYSSSGSQSSYTCTASSSDPSDEAIAVAGFNGISAYSIINSPTTFNGVGSSFSSNYILASSSNVIILVGCGDYPCTSITFPSGCTTEVSENIGSVTEGTAAIAYCQSQESGTYTISGSASSSSARISVEAALP